LPTSLARLLACAALASLGLALVPPRARAGAPPCDLEVRAEPGAVGGIGEATVRISVKAGERPPWLRASTGRIQRLRQAGELWLADWEVPARGPPTVGIVSASDGDRCGFAAVGLAGWTTVRLKARPGESVTLEVGAARFGPVLADAGGRAAVPVVALAGLRRAWQGNRQVDLPAQPEPVLDLVVVEREGPSGAGELLATVFAAASDGTPWAGAPPVLEATAGAADALVPAGSGSWRAIWRASRREPDAELAVRTSGAWRRVRLAEVPGPVARVEVHATPDKARAGDPGGVSVEVLAVDAAGLPAGPNRPELVSDLELAEEPASIEPGRWRTTLQVPAALHGLRQARIEARIGEASGAATVELSGAAPATMNGTVALRSQIAAGSAQGELTVFVADAYGNPTAAEGLVARAARGSLGPPEAGEGGRLVFPYRLERAGEEAVEDTVQLDLGGLSAAVPVRWVPPPPRLVLSPRAGVAARSGGPGLQAGLQATSFWHVGELQLGMAIDLAASDFRSSGRLDAPAVAWSGATALGAASISAAWRTRPSRRLVLVASAGGGAAYLSHRTALEAQRALTEAGWAALGTAALALGTPAWRGGPFLEARATWVPDPGLESLRGGLVTFSLSLGYWLDAL